MPTPPDRAIELAYCSDSTPRHVDSASPPPNGSSVDNVSNIGASIDDRKTDSNSTEDWRIAVTSPDATAAFAALIAADVSPLVPRLASDESSITSPRYRPAARRRP